MDGCGTALADVGLRLHSLGAPRLWYAGQARILRGRPLALLWYLVYTAHAHPRDYLADLLWQNLDSAGARQSLRQALYQLRQVLGEGAAGLQTTRETVAWVGKCVRDTDVWVNNAPLALLQTACLHSSGEFLAGLSVAHAPEFEDWLQGQRWYWHNQRRSGLLRAVAAWRQEGQVALALQALAQQLAFDPSDEGALQHYLPLLFAQAGTQAVAQAYDHWQHRLALQWQLQPSPGSVQLLQRLLTPASPSSPVLKQMWQAWCHAQNGTDWHVQAQHLIQAAPHHPYAHYAVAVSETWRAGGLTGATAWGRFHPPSTTWQAAMRWQQQIAQLLSGQLLVFPLPSVPNNWWAWQSVSCDALWQGDYARLQQAAHLQMRFVLPYHRVWAEQCTWWNWGLALEGQVPDSAWAILSTWWDSSCAWTPLYGWWYARLLYQQRRLALAQSVLQRTLCLAEEWQCLALLSPLYRLLADVLTALNAADAEAARYFAQMWAGQYLKLPAD